MLFIGSRRECFFDDYMVDNTKTTAQFVLHHPQKREMVMKMDMPWEGDGSTCQVLLKDGELYRLYYIGRKMPSGKEEALGAADVSDYVHCYAESRDGIHWERPILNIFEYNGSSKNNILGSRNRGCPGGMKHGAFSVFLDENPNCGSDKRIKAFFTCCEEGEDGNNVACLYAVWSEDGIHFDYENRILVERGGYYDSMHCCFWDDRVKKYRLYIRGHHKPDDYDGPAIDCQDERCWGVRVRDIRYKESEDFIHWGEWTQVLFDDDDYNLPMYENKIISYYRAPHMQIGFPTRYIERKEWTPNYDELTGREKRLERMQMGPRYGLAITDCTFIASHNGIKFKRYAEAFVRPGIENGRNWLYGDVAYPCYNIFETEAEYPDGGKEISMLFHRNEWHGEPTELWRYTIRLDGFASLHADGKEEEVIVTKPFIFEGNDLFINFSTSARGYLYITLTDENGNKITSWETFGDTTDRRVLFQNGKVSDYAGKPVIMQILLRDADIYSFRFGNKEGV